MTVKQSGFRLVLGVVVLLISLSFPTPEPAHARARLWLPTPIGEEWIILQGYRCGSHVGRQSLSLDFVSLRGRTRGAPVRAAASGTTLVWEGHTGTLILSHGGGYYTLYSHIQRPLTTARGVRVRQGQQIGEVGSVGTAVPHLHFNYFYAPDRGAYQRTLQELHFADGYDFPETSGCSQHFGSVVVAKENPDTTPPTVSFHGDVQPDTWYCEDKRIEFSIEDDQWAHGFSQAFNTEPDGALPQFEGDAGYVQLAWAGEGVHTLYVRAWDDSKNQTLASFGPIGYDTTPPAFKQPTPIIQETYTLDEERAVYVSWKPASDGNGSGVAGYYFFLGSDEQGVSDQFVSHHGAAFYNLEPGTYLLRVQAVDRACGKSEWTTVQRVVIAEETPQPAETVTPTLPPTNTPVITPTSTPASRPTSNPMSTPVITPTSTPTHTPMPTSVPTHTPTSRTTSNPTSTPVITPTSTPASGSAAEPPANAENPQQLPALIREDPDNTPIPPLPASTTLVTTTATVGDGTGGAGG